MDETGWICCAVSHDGMMYWLAFAGHLFASAHGPVDCTQCFERGDCPGHAPVPVDPVAATGNLGAIHNYLTVRVSHTKDLSFGHRQWRPVLPAAVLVEDNIANRFCRTAERRKRS